jgi:hypothetical protein
MRVSYQAGPTKLVLYLDLRRASKSFAARPSTL